MPTKYASYFDFQQRSNVGGSKFFVSNFDTLNLQKEKTSALVIF